MKSLTIIIIFLASLNFLSCTDGNSSNNEKLSEANSIDSDIDSTKQLANHIIDIKGEFIPSDNVKSLIEFLEFHVPNGNLWDYAYTFVSHEADLIQTLSFIVHNNSMHYKLYQVLYQSDKIMYEGNAELHTRYRKAGSEFSKYITSNIIGPDFEIHINETDNTASLKFVDEKMMNWIETDLIMERIK